MFGWFRKKDTPADAYEYGRRVAATMHEELTAYTREHLYPAADKVPDAVFGNSESPDAPPLVIARIDLKVFIENLEEKLRPAVVPQLRNAISGWIDVMTEAGMSEEVERLIEHHYSEFKASLVMIAFQRLLDMTDDLKPADDRWRADHPEKAAQIPFYTLGDELADLIQPYLKHEPYVHARAAGAPRSI
jgi:hypothetical protein